MSRFSFVRRCSSAVALVLFATACASTTTITALPTSQEVDAATATSVAEAAKPFDVVITDPAPEVSAPGEVDSGESSTEVAESVDQAVADPTPEATEPGADDLPWEPPSTAGTEWRYSSQLGEYPGPVIGTNSNENHWAFDAVTAEKRRLDANRRLKYAFGGRSPSLDRVERTRDAMFAIAMTNIEVSASRASRTATLVRIDLATGAQIELAELGDEFNDYRARLNDENFVEAATDTHVLVGRLINGGGRADYTYRIFDARTGDLLRELGAIKACDGTPKDFYELADGRVVVESYLGLALMDLGSGSVEDLGSCEDLPAIGDLLAKAPIELWVETTAPSAADSDLAAQLASESIDPWRVPIAAGGGYLWWITAWTRHNDDEVAVIAAAVQYDVDRGEIANVWPMASDVWTTCDDGSCWAHDVGSIGWVEGFLVMSAGCCGPTQVAVLNTETGDIQTLGVDGFPDSRSVTIIDHPPGEIWFHFYDRDTDGYRIARLDIDAMKITEFAEA